MTAKPNDQDRLNFLTQFRLNLVFNGEVDKWQIRMAKGVILETTPRKAIDEAIKWTRKNPA